MPTSEDYEGQVPAWCPGCGNFQILSTIKQALVELGIEPWQVLVVSGIGQAGKLPHYIKCHTFNGLHGRTLPVMGREETIFSMQFDGTRIFRCSCIITRYMD